MSVITAPAEKSIAFATLGCKLNQFETDSLATRFQNAGYRIVEFTEHADVYVVNSCTVTNRADRKSRNLLSRARRRQTPGDSLVVLTGCFVDGHRDELEGDANTYFVPNEQKQSIPELVTGHFSGEVVHPQGTVFDFPVPERVFHTRSTVKIQDGCDNFCSFCIIPFVRGRATSRPWQDVVAAVREAVDGGAREVVLTGVNMSRYADGDVDFEELIARCLEIDGPGKSGETPDYRLRISSLEPDQLTDRFLRLFRHPRMCPHLHLCLQSGSEEILRAMRRQYTYDHYLGLMRELRGIDPLFNVTTDIIVGFPGETDDEFARSLAAVDEAGFGHVHTFPYSVRAGTPAARMGNHVSARVKTDRSAAIRGAAERSKRRYREQLVGHTERMLVERSEVNGKEVLVYELGEHYVPLEARFRPNADPGSTARTLHNRFLDVRVESLVDGDDPVLRGTIV